MKTRSLKGATAFQSMVQLHLTCDTLVSCARLVIRTLDTYVLTAKENYRYTLSMGKLDRSLDRNSNVSVPDFNADP